MTVSIQNKGARNAITINTSTDSYRICYTIMDTLRTKPAYVALTDPVIASS